MHRYHHQKIERKWQKRWEQAGANRAVDFDSRPKFYGLVEFPYPSGEGLHVGHPRSYVAMDIIARTRRLQGHNVLFPIGFDAFGLPAEQYAVKTNTHPAVTTAKNIKTFTRQLKGLGLSFDWSRAFSTTDPNYYRFTQWIFLQLYRHGLAYRAEMPINWCPSCRIGLANEEVIDGRCERCGGEVAQRTKAQWILRITNYAQRLFDDLALVDYPERVRRSQQNWIGRSDGATVEYRIQNTEYRIAVFTTRPDTIFGATFLVLAPKHPLVGNKELGIRNQGAVAAYVAAAQRTTNLERSGQTRPKSGVQLEGIAAVNPATGKTIPVWVADYVMTGYGTGAIMAVPAHDQRDFEFARQHRLPIVPVVVHTGRIRNTEYGIRNDLHKNIPNSKFLIHNSPLGEAFEGADGVLVNSGQFNGLPVREAIPKITAWLKKQGSGQAAVRYKLRDWVFSRQRYWGEPIPIVYCKYCHAAGSRKPEVRDREGVDWVRLDGADYAVVPVPEDQLPVTLPKLKSFQPTDGGDSPLAGATRWARVPCPQCGKTARRETDVMPNWAGSNWYYLAYAMRGISNFEFPISKYRKVFSYWMPIDWYNGGMEHTTLHVLYSRFIYKFLWDIGAVPKACGPEPYRKRTSHGLILGEGGEKMSKSRGNVVNPDAVVKTHGADVLRLYEMFIGPFDQAATWDPRGIAGLERFVASLFDFVHRWRKAKERPAREDAAIETLLQQTIRKVTGDIDAMRFNTAVAQLMVFRNAIVAAASAVSRSQLERFLVILAPFAPHLAEELWQLLGHGESIFQQSWPTYQAAKAQAASLTIVVQVNGKVRGRLVVAAGSGETAVIQQARELPTVKRYLDTAAHVRVVYVKNRLVNFVTI